MQYTSMLLLAVVTASRALALPTLNYPRDDIGPATTFSNTATTTPAQVEFFDEAASTVAATTPPVPTPASTPAPIRRHFSREVKSPQDIGPPLVLVNGPDHNAETKKNKHGDWFGSLVDEIFFHQVTGLR
ncbi:hypothetical protein K474DRAFT_1710557 [Panus rudis PR-1116 ss-1]|nr:hypothetical protein K474DRAFT_1710557 [Panus rudis PR-1116 ss-1]